MKGRSDNQPRAERVNPAGGDAMNTIRMTAEQTRIWDDGDYPQSERMMRTLRQRADEMPLVDIRDQAVLDDIADGE